MTDAFSAESPHRPVALLVTTSFLVAARVRAALGGPPAPAADCVSTIARAEERLASARVVALLAEPRDARGEATARLVEAARRRAPDLPVIALMRHADGLSPAALALLATRPALIAVAEAFDPHAVRAAVLAPLEERALVAAVWPHLAPELPAALHPIVQAALLRAAQPLPVSALALALRVHRKTLWQQCRREGIASVQALLTWCRLIAFSHALRTRAQPVERIANEMAFASPTALRNATRRYLGVTPTALRAAGGEALACQRFGRWLREERRVTAGDMR